MYARSMRIKSKVRAGGISLNRNGVKVKTKIRSGGKSLNHNATRV